MKLYYKEYGKENEQVIVITHGLFGSSDNWGSIAKKLGEEYRVIVADARDHGRSPSSIGISYPVMAEDFKELFDDLGLKEVVFVGHSMGGKTAMEFAQHYPELLKFLIVVDISPKEHENSHNLILEGLISADLDVLTSRQDVEIHLRSFVPEPGVIQFLMKGLYWQDDGKLGWRMNAPLIKKDLENILAATGPERVKVPTLFIKGGQSNYIEREDIPAIKEQFPNCRVVTIEHAGHWVHAQAPEEVMDLIRECAAS
jgi:pimeloyl-ACP methyl ester carboxylesterase